MGRGRRRSGTVLIGTGSVVILSRVMPVRFWWFAAGAALIAVGLYMIRCQ